MLKNVKKSGVVFTADMNTYAPYYIINYQEGSDTEAVTSGETNKLKTMIIYKKLLSNNISSNMRRLVKECKKIEKLLNNEHLDIEFAIDDENKIYIFQVRPIALGKKVKSEGIDIDKALNKIYMKIENLNCPRPFILGKKTCYGVMPDWNPAEILGVRPKKLAISLYKELITDNIWANQRLSYGYRNLTMHPLMTSLCGIPYIDTRITFNSFIPQKLNESIAEKLVDYYITKLVQYPAYHDKIEFEIVFSCYYLGLSNKLNTLKEYGFNSNEIRRIEYSLLDLTNKIIKPKDGVFYKDLDKIKELIKNHNIIINSTMTDIDKVYWLIQECKENGTLPFAGVARAAFIAIQFLNSFVEMGIISHDDYANYMNSLNTVNKKLKTDTNKLFNGEIDKNDFLEKYGHIRPGTYDILSERYDEGFDKYFYNTKCDNKNMLPVESQNDNKKYSFTDEQKNIIQNQLEENGLEISVNELIEFIKTAIEGREYLKFEFTKSVSEILRLIEKIGKSLDISKEDMAHLDIYELKQCYVDLYNDDLRKIFADNINKNKKQFECAQLIKLPSIIVNPEEIYAYHLLEDEPNFVGNNSITGEVVLESDIEGQDIENKIIFIQAADPGYDFLFSKNIGGLVTQFGGVNSHMAIRCSEMGIPAIIGVGEKRFERWGKCKKIQVDCLKKSVTVLQK